VHALDIVAIAALAVDDANAKADRLHPQEVDSDSEILWAHQRANAAAKFAYAVVAKTRHATH